MKIYRLTSICALLIGLSTSVASAHIGLSEIHDGVDGFVHPFTGLDHVLAMISVGLIAAHLGGRAIWLVPASFVSVMSLGFVLNMSKFQILYFESGISLSILAFGLVLMLSLRAHVAIAMCLVGFFSLFHGFAHGASMPANVSGSDFVIGFIVATGLLHVFGITVGLSFERRWAPVRVRAMRLGGGLIAFAGLGMISGAF